MKAKALATALAVAAVTLGTIGCTALGDLRQEAQLPSARVIDTLPSRYEIPGGALGSEIDLAERRNQEFGLVPFPELSSYLNGILGRIKSETGISDLPGTVYVTANELPEYNTTADANIFISLGVLKNLDTEDEIVALLAHELAHVIFGDHGADQLSNYQKRLQEASTTAMALYRAFGKDDVQDTVAKYSDILNVSSRLVEITDVIILPHWRRSQEASADFFAADIGERLGYSYNAGLKRVQEKIAAFEEAANLRKIEERRRQQEKERRSSTNDLRELSEELKQAVLKVGREVLSRNHKEASERLVQLGAYREKFYPDARLRRAQPGEWASIKNGPAFSELVEKYALARKARMLLDERRNREGVALARSAATGVTSDHPLPMYALARAYRARNDRENLERILRAGRESPEAIWYFYEMTAEIEFSRGRVDNGLRILEDGYRRFGYAPSLRVRMIDRYRRLGRQDSVERLQSECNTKTPYLREICAQAASGKREQV